VLERVGPSYLFAGKGKKRKKVSESGPIWLFSGAKKDLRRRGYVKGKEALHTRPRVAYHTPMWTKAIAVGTMEFPKLTRARVGTRAKGSSLSLATEAFELREPAAAYWDDFGAKNYDINIQNTFLWQVYHGISTI
jgi:hypothetical protein